MHQLQGKAQTHTRANVAGWDKQLLSAAIAWAAGSTALACQGRQSLHENPGLKHQQPT